MDNLSDFGVRAFVNLFARFITYYARHKINIDANLTPQTVTFLDGLLDVADSIIAMNVPGPNPVVPAQDDGGL